MTIPTYSTGAVSVAANGTVVTGNGGPLWLSNVKEGDWLSIDGGDVTMVLNVTDDSHLTILPWKGGAKFAVPYVIVENFSARDDSAEIAKDVAKLVAALNKEGFIWFVGPDETEPDPSVGDEGQWAYQPSTELKWVKTGGSWVLTDSLRTSLSLSAEGKVEWAPAGIDHGPFQIEASDFEGNPRLYMSYNMTPKDWTLGNLADVGMCYGMETDYNDGTPNHKTEMYWQYQFISGRGNSSTCTYRRSIMAQWDKVTDLPTVLYLGSGGNLGIRFCHNDGTGDVYEQQVVGKEKMLMNSPYFKVWNQPGGTTSALEVDSSEANCATGIEIKSYAAGAGAHINATSSAINENLYLDARGSGLIILNGLNNAPVYMSGSMYTTDQDTGCYLFSANIQAFLAGGANVLRVDGSAGSVATGLDVIGQAATGGVHLKTSGGGTSEGLYLDAKGTAPVVINQDGGGLVLLPDLGASFTSDQDTGIYRVSADVLGFKAGNLPALTLSTTGLIANGIQHSFGPGGTGASNCNVVLNASSAVNRGATFLFQKNGSNSFAFGHTSGLTGGSQNDVGLYNYGLSAYALTIAAVDSGATFANKVVSSHATAGIGYSTGAGGAVTQATSRSTGVTLNKVSGAITLVSAAGSATPATFTVTNSAVAATDVVVVSQKSGTDKYVTQVTATAAGSFQITFYTTGGTTTEQPVFNFAVIKAVAA